MPISSARQIRAFLLASTTIIALPAVLQAQSPSTSSRPIDSVEQPHDNGPAAVSSPTQPSSPAESTEKPQDGAPTTSTETPEIVINNNFTPAQTFDPTNVNGIGQIVSDAGGGAVGLCTGTLINPRTVIFAAHCVNTRAATAYGAGSGGVGIAVGFETNTRANAAGQPDELVNWLLGAGAGPGRFQSNTAQHLYNMNQVFWNPLSVSPSSCTAPTSCFLEADVALGTLDTPARNVPTWALLFSPLATPTSINPANGTGYHVTVTGYGRNGNGTTGAVGNDFRRRLAENMLGALTSLNDRNVFLFGTAGAPSRPQVLYFLDFDDPARANTRDFNGFRDNALPREGSTGPGDSGGPLIIDQAFARQVVIGVLSGGSTFFAGQPGGSYGTQSFYQPLFLYWDWIAANNPYRYVTATAGNGNWEDAGRWLTELDPNYQILVGGGLVNGLPTNPGGGPTENTPRFGEYCFQQGAINECQDAGTGAIRNNVPNNPSDAAPLGSVTTADMAIRNVAIGESEIGAESPTGRLDMVNARDAAMSTRVDVGGAADSPLLNGFSIAPNPAPTLTNGLPGATNFVPNNFDGVRTTGVSARYYNVTLRNAGTITLNSAVTIDNFAIVGASSRLNVASGASLASLMEINQLTGTMQVDGTVSSVGDYFLMSGLLTGAGRINSPFLTSVLGGIAPGTMGGIGTLTIGGNLVLSSGNALLIDIGAAAASDRLAVVTNGTGSGNANIGGTVMFNVASGQSIRAGDIYTFLTAQGGITGTFSSASALSAILRPTFIYSANQVQARIDAASYFTVANSPVTRSYAGLLDRNRAAYSNFSGLFGFLDMQNAATIQATLESWAPRTEVLKSAVGVTALDNMARFYDSRLASMDLEAGMGGTVATIGQPLQFAAFDHRTSNPGQLMAGGASGTTDVQEGRLPETMRAFFAGGYLDGRSDSMATAMPFGGNDEFDGYYVAAGIETELADNAALGFALSYTDMDGTTGGAAQGASGKLYQGTLYGKLQSAGGIVLDTQVSAGMFSARTQRSVAVGPTTFDLRSKDDVLALTGEVGLSKQFNAGALKLGPRVAMRASRIAFTPTVESGGGPALAFDRGNYDSVQGMAGLTLSGGVKIRPYASAYYVHDFEDRPASFGANFVGGVGLPAAFALAGQDQDWFEASAGVAFGGETFEVSLGADTTIGRSDVRNRSYRGSVTFRF